MDIVARQLEIARAAFATAKSITLAAVRDGDPAGRRAAAYRASRLLRDALRYNRLAKGVPGEDD